jgi:hypothetical protein
MKTTRHIIHSAALTLTVLATSLASQGCAANATGDSEPSSTNATHDVEAAEATGTVLARVQDPSGITVTFRELGPGEILIDERGPATATSLLGARHGESATEIYQIVSHGQEPPQALADAEARRVTLKGASPAAAAPSSAVDVPEALRTPVMVPMTNTSGQNNFESYFCGASYPIHDALVAGSCQVGSYALSTPTSYSTWYQAQGYDDPTSIGTGELYYEYFNGSTWSTIDWPLTPGESMGFIYTGPTPASRFARVTGWTIGVASYAWTPTIGSGSLYYPQDLSFTGSGFVKDTAVAVYVNAGNTGNKLVTASWPVGSDGSIVVNHLPYACANITYEFETFTITAVGTTSGASATTPPVSGINCY